MDSNSSSSFPTLSQRTQLSNHDEKIQPLTLASKHSWRIHRCPQGQTEFPRIDFHLKEFTHTLILMTSLLGHLQSLDWTGLD